MKHPRVKKCFSTTEAATLLLRQPQTLRVWAMTGKGPITPLRIHGRLAWRESDVLRLINDGVRHANR
ncbi:MAG: DNA-binding protein [Gammaproteobacteria bacterium]|nr:DNA-binding protein [Gammaproteobacteria bacterium]